MTAPDFDRMYIEEGDPWKVGSSWYEQRKIAVALACLADPSYDRVLDPACGTGHLARAVAERSGMVVAKDASAPAVEIARRVCESVENVDIDVAALPYASGETAGPFDLIVLSEFLYYLSPEMRRLTIGSVLDRAADRAEIIAVHWRDAPEDGTSSGDDVHIELRERLKVEGFRHQVAHFDEEFVVDDFTRGHDHHTD